MIDVAMSMIELAMYVFGYISDEQFQTKNKDNV